MNKTLASYILMFMIAFASPTTTLQIHLLINIYFCNHSRCRPLSSVLSSEVMTILRNPCRLMIECRNVDNRWPTEDILGIRYGVNIADTSRKRIYQVNYSYAHS
jgi:hypothetical protein